MQFGQPHGGCDSSIYGGQVDCRPELAPEKVTPYEEMTPRLNILDSQSALK